MAYSTCKIKNISGAQTTVRGQLYEVEESLPITDSDRVAHATDDGVCASIINDEIEIHDSEGAIVGHAFQIAHLQDY